MEDETLNQEEEVEQSRGRARSVSFADEEEEKVSSLCFISTSYLLTFTFLDSERYCRSKTESLRKYTKSRRGWLSLERSNNGQSEKACSTISEDNQYCNQFGGTKTTTGHGL